MSLHFYLTNSDEEDLSFVTACAKNGADVEKALKQSLECIENKAVCVKLKDPTRRIEFINGLFN